MEWMNCSHRTLFVRAVSCLHEIFFPEINSGREKLAGEEGERGKGEGNP